MTMNPYRTAPTLTQDEPATTPESVDAQWFQALWLAGKFRKWGR